MSSIMLTVKQTKVYDEVAKTTSYTGAKMIGDAEAYERIFTTDADRDMLKRFWDEACNGATEEFKQFISSITTTTDYSVVLAVSSSFNTMLSTSMASSLYSYFVNYIVAKWFAFTNKGDAEAYSTSAAAAMLDVKSKLYYRKKPTRTPPMNVLPTADAPSGTEASPPIGTDEPRE